MKHILVATFITLLALGMGCAWISPASQTASEGIQVHGHWTVTVTNPDGSVDAVHEFDNAFTSSGSSAVTGLLSGESTVDSWEITFSRSQNLFYCLEGGRAGGGRENIVTARVTRDETVDAPLRLSATCTVTRGQGESLELQGVSTHIRGTFRSWSPRQENWREITNSTFSSHRFFYEDRVELVENQRIVANVLFTFVPGP